MLRRRFFKFVAGSILFALLGTRSGKARARNALTFEHGVASGDPLTDGVILWTRVSGALTGSIEVTWQIATDAEMRNVLQQGRVETGPQRDYTVKVDVRQLPTGSQLYYRFLAGTATSPIGRTRTLPQGKVDSATFAVVSCSSYPTGYFHAYRDIASRSDLDAVIHLGDYIYEYGLGEYATEYAEALDRVPDPEGELFTLSDYRRRHAQYKSDPDSRAMLAAHPLIAVWDDHEIANDAWRGGAENHNDLEGGWSERVDTAVQAYLEWMPVRADAAGVRTRIYREFRYGDLLSLIMLDTRLHGRDEQPVINAEMSNAEIGEVLGESSRSLLGEDQAGWLRESLEHARDSVWQVIGQQLLVASVRAPDLEPLLDLDKPAALSREMLDQNIAMSKKNTPLLLDTWDGYDAARERLYADLETTAVNPVFLSGDLHTSIASNLIPQGADKPVAVEFMAPSVTSPGFDDYLPQRRPRAVVDATIALNPHLAYMETERRGWLCMSFNRTECTGEWHLLDNIRSTDYTVTLDKRLSVAAGRIEEGLYAG